MRPPFRDFRNREFSAFKLLSKESHNNPNGYILRIHIIEGSNLAIRDAWGTSDPYCVLNYGDQTAKTKIIKRNLNPKWDQAFIFNVPNSSIIHPTSSNKNEETVSCKGVLKLECYDYDFGSKDEAMGTFDYDLSKLQFNEMKTESFQLKNVESGVIHVKILFTNAQSSSLKDPFRFATQAVRAARSVRKRCSATQGFLSVVMIEASELAFTDPSTANAYSKIKLGGTNTTWRTKPSSLPPNTPNSTNSSSSSPSSSIITWNEKFDLNLRNCDASLEVSIWDKCFGSDDFLGTVDIPFDELKQDFTHDLWLDLQGTESGKIHLLLTLTSVTLDNTLQNIPLTDIIEPQKPIIGIMDVTVVRAENLLAMDFGGTSDPFCVLNLGNSMRRTDTILSTLNPEWNKSFQFDITDVHSVLDVEVFDQDPGDKRDFLGKVQIPLLNASCGRYWYVLKSKKMFRPTRGRILLEINIKWNWIKAGVRCFQKRENAYLNKEPNFKRKVFMLQVERVKRIIFNVINMVDLQSLFEWENRFDSALALTVYIFSCLYLELWMVPLLLVGGLVAGKYTRGGTRSQKWLEHYLEGQNKLESDESNDNINNTGNNNNNNNNLTTSGGGGGGGAASAAAGGGSRMRKKLSERKGLRDTLHEVEETLSKIQNGLSDFASYCERITNVMNWTIPFCTGLIVICLLAASLVMYIIPFRYLLLMAGLNKFTKKFRRKGPRVDNNEALNFLQCIPSHLEVIQHKNIIEKS